MAVAKIYRVSIQVSPGNTNSLIGINIATIDYNITPVALDSSDPNLADTIESRLNGIGFGNIFSAAVIGAYVVVTTICFSPIPDHVSTMDIDVPGSVDFSVVQICASPTVTGTLDIDCDDLSCLLFTDTTGEYNASSNPTGYGFPPNYPSISDIVATGFTVYNNDGTWDFSDSGYIPSASGAGSICLPVSSFVDSGDPWVPVPGETYNLSYRLLPTNGDESTELSVEFVWPCCGAAVDSNLGTSFSLTEKSGCGSVDFTDTTGSYNAQTNPGGYGTPNPGYADITSTVITITLADGTVINISWMPTADDQTLNITAATLGYPDGVILPQVATVAYSVYTPGTCRVGYKSSLVLFHCALRNCIVNRGKAILDAECATGCKDNTTETNDSLALIFRYEALLLASYTNLGCLQAEVEALYNQCKEGCDTC